MVPAHIQEPVAERVQVALHEGVVLPTRPDEVRSPLTTTAAGSIATISVPPARLIISGYGVAPSGDEFSTTGPSRSKKACSLSFASAMACTSIPPAVRSPTVSVMSAILPHSVSPK